MREIKFRAWHRELGYMFEVALISFKNRNVMQKDSLTSVWGMDSVELMQYTGLKDKNGKEIYFDDLIKDIDGDVFQIVEQPYWIGVKKIKTGFHFRLENIDKPEIIGNMHEHPELLSDSVKGE